jgi:hypothetical protein
MSDGLTCHYVDDGHARSSGIDVSVHADAVPDLLPAATDRQALTVAILETVLLN